MEMSTQKNEQSVYVEIIGPIDNETAEELKDQLKSLLGENFREAIFDLSFVPFITSSGIGKFLLFYKNIISSGRTMKINGISDNLYELFKSIKLDQLFSIQKKEGS
jgi:anti-anti-sigma factor